MFRIFATIAPSTAASRSASSKTRNGALPPSSMETRSRLPADSSARRRPTSVDPVNESFRVRGSCNSGRTSAPGLEVVTRLSTPAGRPASSRTRASSSIERGVCSAGFTTIVQPAAIAGATLRVPIAMGKFQGVTSTHGPTGWCMTTRRPAPDGATVQLPSMRTASSENQRRKSAA